MKTIPTGVSLVFLGIAAPQGATHLDNAIHLDPFLTLFFCCMPSIDLNPLLPRPEEYDIHPETGFLPMEAPLRRLGHVEWDPWERLMDDFHELLLAGKLRSRIHRLPLLDVETLETVQERRRAFLVLSMLSHGYVWGKHEPVAQSLPACLSVPWCKVADRLGLRPVACHAALVLWNWKLLDPEEPRDLSNLATLETFSGAMDESWFYLITTAMEAQGGCVVMASLTALTETLSSTPNLDRLHDALTVLSTKIWEFADILERMYERCDPYVFFWRVRAHLAGWSNMAAAGLPHGLHYAGVDPPGRYRKYSGGSAGQSALMHLLDVILGVKHSKTGTPGEGKNAFLRGMRDYMPKPHAEFLAKLESVCNLREFCMKCKDERVKEKFNAAVEAVKVFRDRHIKMVTLYIVLPARKGPASGGQHSVVGAQGVTSRDSMGGSRPETPPATPHGEDAADAASVAPTVVVDAEKEVGADEERAGLGGFYPQEAFKAPSHVLGTEFPPTSPTQGSVGGLARKVETNEVVRGTGGTDLIPFLRQCRDETTNTKLG